MPKNRYLIEAITKDSRGRIISSAFNNYKKTHPLQVHFATLAGKPKCMFLHAEILALLRAKDKTVHSLEIINHNSHTLPYPCPVCQLAISKYGVKSVKVFSKKRT